MISRIAALILLASTALPICAQTPPSVSDAVILIQPFGESNMLALTFSKSITHSTARQLLQDLAKRGGWKLGVVEIKDDTVPDFSDPSKMVLQTGVSTTISGGELMHDGGYRLQPFVEVFADYSQIEILFIEDTDPSFSGLQRFENAAVSVELIKAGSPYRYRIRIDKNAGPIPKIPVTQAMVPPPPPARITKEATVTRTGSMAFVLLVSAASGLAVFFGLLLVSHLRGRRGA